MTGQKTKDDNDNLNDNLNENDGRKKNRTKKCGHCGGRPLRLGSGQAKNEGRRGKDAMASQHTERGKRGNGVVTFDALVVLPYDIEWVICHRTL